MASPFITPVENPQVVALAGSISSLAAAAQSTSLIGWIPPGDAQLQQVQIAVTEELTAGAITWIIATIDLDDIAAGPAVVSTGTLDSTHFDMTWIGPLDLNARTILLVLVDPNINMLPTPIGVVGGAIAVLS